MNENSVINDAGRCIPKFIEGLGHTIPYRNKHREIVVNSGEKIKQYKYRKQSVEQYS